MAAVPLVVPSASVLLKWVLPGDEPYTDRALLLRAAILQQRVQVLVPALWLYEAGERIARRFPTHAGPCLAALLQFSVQEALPSQAWLAKALELTRRYEVSFCDAAYHAFALLHQGVFVTDDGRYVSLARDSGAVIELRKWRPPRPPAPRRQDGHPAGAVASLMHGTGPVSGPFQGQFCRRNRSFMS